ncbi:hypothetical protein FOCC_FOCC017632 [Frankliniella occidentalis]|nr:hypothetical protein FOCC_FOCC017632 [Frankliniella occidentalis]
MCSDTGSQAQLQCVDCAQHFPNFRLLNQHRRSEHLGGRPYSCPHCEAAFKRSEHLARHMLRHTGETPFTCPYCQTRFRRRDCMIQHVKKHAIAT